MKKPNYFYIFVLIMVVVVLIYVFTSKEGIIFTRQVNVSTILYNSSFDNMTKMNMIEKTDLSEPLYTNIIDKNTFCTGVSPYPSVTANGGVDCANARVEALKKLYEEPNGAYDTNVSVYSIVNDSTLDNNTKISVLKQIPINETNSDNLTNRFKNEMIEHGKCVSDGGGFCNVNSISVVKRLYNP
jgi:hypothetical protein